MPRSHLRSRTQHQAYLITFWQFVCLICLTLIGLALKGKQVGFSIFAGGMAYFIAQLVFVWRVFRYAGAQQMTQFVAAFMLGEALKLILSGILFIVIVKCLPVSLLSVLIGFIGAIVSFWVVCFWQFSKQPTIK